MYICKDCGWSSKNKQSYCAHRRIHSLNPNIKSGFKIAAERNKGITKCIYCGSEFDSYNAMIGHYKSCYNYNKEVYGINSIINNHNLLFKFYWIDELDEYRENVLSEYMDINFPTILNIKCILSLNKNTNGLLYALFKLSNVKELFNKLYDKYTIPELANLLNINDSTLCRNFRNYGVNKRWFRSSKIHLRYRSKLRELLGHNTITEYRVGKYFIDEYCPDLNLAIEFDGEAWHDKYHDKIRESEINSIIGCEFIRIPVKRYDGIDDKEFIKLITEFKQNLVRRSQ